MKPNLVLLPGMMCDARLFTPQINALSSSHSLFIPSFTPSPSITTIAQEILNITPPSFALLGLSMGGIIAMEIMRIAPHRVSHLALCDTNPFADTPKTQALRQHHIQQVRKGKLKEVMRDALKPRYLASTPHKNTILDICMAMALSLGDDTFIQQNNALSKRHSQETTLSSIQIPTLILCGKEDNLCPLSHHTFMNTHIKNSTLSVIEKAGHLPTLENPHHTNREIESWLRKS